METYDATKKPSKRLTTAINNCYNNEQERKEAAKTAKALDETKQGLNEKILELIDLGYAPLSGSEYGVVVFGQSSRIAYERLYRILEKALSERYPQNANKIKELSANLEREALENLEQKRAVVCDENSKLEEMVKRIEKAELENGKITRKVELVMYT